jgi:hypothetical protein
VSRCRSCRRSTSGGPARCRPTGAAAPRSQWSRIPAPPAR